MLDIILRAVGVLMQWAEGYAFYRMLSCMMKPRKNPVVRVISWLGFSSIVVVVIYPEDPVNITYALIGFLLLNWMAFQERWLLRISAVMLFYPIVVAVNYLIYEGVGRLISTVAVYGTLIHEMLYNFSFLLPLIFWWVYYLFVRKRLGEISELLDDKSWILLDIICVASMGAIFGFIYFTPKNSFAIIPCMIACIVTNLGSVRLAFYMADSIYADLERKNLRMQENYYSELENNQQQIRKFRHDMKNHFAAVGELLREENYEEAKDYFEKLSGHMEARNRQFCKNGIVNALLNVKYNTAMELGIDTFSHISIDGMMGIDEIHLCTIFANTLDNAIEACAKIEELSERKISVKARYTENGYFSYEIVNSKANEVREKKGKFFTDKEDKKSHGLGVASVREIVEKYKGTMDVSYTENEFRVVILISVA